MQIHIYILFTDKKTIDCSEWYISIHTIINLDPVENGRRTFGKKSREPRVQVPE